MGVEQGKEKKCFSLESGSVIRASSDQGQYGFQARVQTRERYDRLETVVMTAFDSKAALQSLLSEYRARATAIRRDLSRTYSPDFAEQAQQRQNDEVLEALLAEAEEGMREARRALQRLDEGVYGVCVCCGEEVGEKRLQVMPAAPCCVLCADLSR